MSSSLTIKELRTMQSPELHKEVRAQRTVVQKMRMQIEMNTEKDSARYRREKRALSRMLTILTEKASETLKKPAKSSTLPASPKRPKRSS